MRIQTAVTCQKDDFIHYFICAKMERQITSIKTKLLQRMQQGICIFTFVLTRRTMEGLQSAFWSVKSTQCLSHHNACDLERLPIFFFFPVLIKLH